MFPYIIFGIPLLTPEIIGVIRFLFIFEGSLCVIGGLLFWIFKEDAGSDNPAHYWFWFSSGPYIRSAETRIEHITFKSKVLLAFGIPVLLIGIFCPNVFFEVTNIIGIGFLIFAPFILHLIIVADAVERDKYSAEGMSE